MKKIILTTCLLILLTGCDNQNLFNKQENENSEKTAIENQEKDKSIESSQDNSLSIYSNKKYGYEFEYPTNYKVVDTKGTDSEKNKSVKIVSPEKYFNSNGKKYFSSEITVLSTEFKPNFDSYKINNSNKWGKETMISINGYQGVLLENYNYRGENIVLIFSKKDTYELIAPSYDSMNQDEFNDYSAVFKDIYESFRILN
jgi:hypothetical protein